MVKFMRCVLAALALAITPALAQAPSGGGDIAGSATVKTPAPVTGEQVYVQVCQACHMADAKGGSGAATIPALAALVVGCGLGDDAELIAGLGYRTLAFDISASAIEAARQRFPRSAVSYRVADLMAAPADWRQAYDLVVESMTLQALPDPPRATAIASLAALVAPGGTLIVFARGREPGTVDDGPPWSLTRPEIEAIAAGQLEVAGIDEVRDSGPSTAAWRWRAEFRRR